MNSQIKQIKVLKSQMEFLKAQEKEILYSGGFGSGKSLALCIRLVQQASIPGNICLLVRKHLTILRKSTLRMLIESEGTRPPILPPESYEMNKLERTIQLHGGGVIIFTGCDDEMSIRSVNCGDIFVDEASELDEKEYFELLFRLRVDVGGLRIHSCTNPGSKSHFLYKRFEIDKNPTRRIIYASSMDNTFLPENNLEWLDSLKGDARSRYVEGQWGDTEKMIYPCFTHTNNVKDMDKVYPRYVIGVDYGYSNPAALILCGIDSDNRLNIIEEFFKARLLVSNIVKEIKRMVDWVKGDDIMVIVDPSAAALIAECEAAGIPAQKANNEVMIGIDRVRDRIDSKRLMVDPLCTNVIRELTGYTYDDMGKPVKQDDHSCDAIRYVANYLADYEAKYSNGKVFIF